jgi:acetyltransferase-like isoleucine patch superfamily enzyme
LKSLKSYFGKFIYFINPNKLNLLRNRIIYKSLPEFQQITLCKGKGLVEIGNNCSFGYKIGGFNRGGSVELQARYWESKVKIGNNVKTNNNIFLCAANYIEIGDDVLIGQNVVIMDHEAHSIEPLRRKKLGEIGKVIISKNVWVGNNVTILKNSEIGENSIVATGAVVTGIFPSNVIIGGVPAKIVKII